MFAAWARANRVMNLSHRCRRELRMIVLAGAVAALVALPVSFAAAGQLTPPLGPCSGPAGQSPRVPASTGQLARTGSDATELMLWFLAAAALGVGVFLVRHAGRAGSRP